MLLVNAVYIFCSENLIFFVYLQVGESYGRKMLTSALRSKGILVGETKVRNILKEINPNAQKAREYSAERSLNPKVYKADCFGYKINYDQNKKLELYGVVHVCA